MFQQDAAGVPPPRLAPRHDVRSKRVARHLPVVRQRPGRRRCEHDVCRGLCQKRAAAGDYRLRQGQTCAARAADAPDVPKRRRRVGHRRDGGRAGPHCPDCSDRKGPGDGQVRAAARRRGVHRRVFGPRHSDGRLARSVQRPIRRRLSSQSAPQPARLRDAGLCRRPEQMVVAAAGRGRVARRFPPRRAGALPADGHALQARLPQGDGRHAGLDGHHPDAG
mmetsp:Transcript_32814/g.110611  ORF Transcript_32814/g.110611 Transcript_32814/m.110611 type:complete len:221 (+) Transcript_32814:1107-1769(+)